MSPEPLRPAVPRRSLTQATDETVARLRRDLFHENMEEAGNMPELNDVVEAGLLDLTAARREALDLDASVAENIAGALRPRQAQHIRWPRPPTQPTSSRSFETSIATARAMPRCLGKPPRRTSL